MDRLEPAANDPGKPVREVDPMAVEARRQLAICNICNYCNGLCAVFAAAERRPALTGGDLDHLANLCHHCRSCLYDCQYAPPHPFAVNLPRALARERWASYGRYAWPSALAGLLDGDGRLAARVAAGVVLVFTLTALLAVPPAVLFSPHNGPGAFYRVIPWWLMATVGGLSFGCALLAVGAGVARFWRATRADALVSRPRPGPVGVDQQSDHVASRGQIRGETIGPAVIRATRELLTLENQQGGGPGCADLDHRPSRLRRRFHHALFYGFLLCFAATLVATGYHHLLGRAAPYPLPSAPVLLGTIGGIGMVIGCIGLLWLRRHEDPAPTDPDSRGADVVALWLLLAVAATGLALLALRATVAMGLLLAVHLGTVLALFLLLPFGKLVHGAYRGAALLRDALEMNQR